MFNAATVSEMIHDASHFGISVENVKWVQKYVIISRIFLNSLN